MPKLAIVRSRGWHNPEIPFPMPVTSVKFPQWRALQGRKIHRPLHGMIYSHFDNSQHMSMTWLCGNSTNKPIPVKPDCLEGLEECLLCEAKYRIRAEELADAN